MATREEQLLAARRSNLESLVKLGLNPFPPRSQKDIQFSTITSDFDKHDGQEVTTAGRVIAIRTHGQMTFIDLKDETGKLQLILREDSLAATDKKAQTLGYAHLDLLDAGDIVQVTGQVTKSKRGEISVEVNQLSLITKALLPLPDKWYGLKDVEERFRKRYLDTIMNQDVMDRLKVRSQIITSMRNFLDSKGFLEVETPTLQPVYGGGFARPFSTHHNALDLDLYLRISDEMYLKRLIVGGMEKVYEITKVFRNEGIDLDHNPEFTMFEAQIAYEDYRYGMDLIEEITEQAAKDVFGTTEFEYQGEKISVKRPWKRYRVVEAVQEFTGVDPLGWKTLDEAKSAVHKMAIPENKLKDLDRMDSIGEVIAFAFEETCEEKLIQPTIIYDYPVEVSPLAKKCEDPRFTERFEQFAFGSELGNNYTELNDPDDLYARFVEEKKREKAGFDEAHQTDHDYLTAIKHGFPPTCGIAIGIDRMVMMMTDAKSIREVIAFPLLRPENKEGK
jgi:lysyl-tRNA synthetase class 2